ncbi:hypothetical protein [Rhizobium sp. R693]|uniref:hypothetical protein n=1 Tax=Rhizobium sp. R693 TaxID=1764276 RepID=UPI000B533A52|nr:hypothetical protein [Rhizobium sp. R693]OWV99924.1 hypothetical protein ATY79_00795 [Rhizobium sp. R693]
MQWISWQRPVLVSKITELIDRILRNWCDENGHQKGSAEASQKAKSLLQWIELGVTDEHELTDLIRDDIVITTK